MAQPEKKNDGFYSELDEAHKHTSCSCGQIIFFLVFLFLFGSFMVWWGIGQIRQRVATDKIPISNDIYNQAKNKIDSFFVSKTPVNNLNPNLTLTLTDQELTAILLTASKNNITGRYVLSNPSVAITTSSMIVTGQLVKPFSAQVRVTGQPVIISNKIHFKTDQIYIGALLVPQFLNSGINDAVDSMISNQLNDPRIKYENVTLQEHALLLTGTKF